MNPGFDVMYASTLLSDLIGWDNAGATLATVKPRIDIITASRVELVLILLPAITWLEASCMLALSGVPAHVAARVLTQPFTRRRAESTSSGC